MTVLIFVPFDKLLVTCVFNYKAVIRPFQVLDTDFELLVNLQSRVVHFPQGSSLFFHILKKKPAFERKTNDRYDQRKRFDIGELPLFLVLVPRRWTGAA